MKKIVFRVLLPLLFWLALWMLLSCALSSPLLLPRPDQVLRRLCDLILTGEFWRAVAATLLRILCGTLGGILLGVLLAAATCRFSMLDTLFSPLLTVIKSTPVASFIVLVLIWVGRSIVPSIIAVLMVLPVVWANVCSGIRGVDQQLLEFAKVFRFSRCRTLKYIYLPTIRPHFLAALRSALGMAWKAGVAAEVLTVPAVSIGKRLMDAKIYLETTDLFAWTLVVILCSLGIEKLLFAVFERLGKSADRGGKRK